MTPSPNTVRLEEIDHEMTDEVVCPYCGYEHDNSWEFFFDGEEVVKGYCGECDELILIRQNHRVTYTTEKIEK